MSERPDVDPLGAGAYGVVIGWDVDNLHDGVHVNRHFETWSEAHAELVERLERVITDARGALWLAWALRDGETFEERVGGDDYRLDVDRWMLGAAE